MFGLIVKQPNRIYPKNKSQFNLFVNTIYLGAKSFLLPFFNLIDLVKHVIDFFVFLPVLVWILGNKNFYC